MHAQQPVTDQIKVEHECPHVLKVFNSLTEHIVLSMLSCEAVIHRVLRA